MSSFSSVNLAAGLESMGPQSEDGAVCFEEFARISQVAMDNIASCVREGSSDLEEVTTRRIAMMRDVLGHQVRKEVDSMQIPQFPFPENEVQADNLIRARDDFVSSGELFLKRLEFVMDFVHQEMQKIDPRAAENFKIMQEGVCKKATDLLEMKLATIFYSSFSHFYSTMFDSFPDLHEQFHGSDLGDELFLMHSDIESFLESERQNLTEEQIQTLDAASSRFLLGSQISRLQRESPKLAKEFCKNLAEDVIPHLEIGEQIIIPGVSKRHAILYQITRVDQDNYIFMIINTGDDEDKLYSRKSVLTKMWETISGSSPRYAHKGYRVKIDVFTPDFLEKIAYCETKDIPAPKLISWFDQVFLREGNGSEEWGRLHHPQERGNCAPKCVASQFKEMCIQSHGEIEGNILYYRTKSYRAQKKLGLIKKLEHAAGEKTLKNLYSDLVHAKSEIYDHYAIPKVIKRIPPDDALLQERLTDMQDKAATVITKWTKKASAPSQKFPTMGIA